jgi:nicotinate phosphoribosyltransferase
MTRPDPWVDAASAALLTDVYELTMLQAYHAEGMNDRAVFSLFFRRLPPGRNYLLACGLEDALRYLENLRFTPDALDYLRRSQGFRESFLAWLADFRFGGDVWALPEGTPVFPDEPLLEIEAPIPEAQLPETYVMNQIQLQTLLASKAARLVHAAAGRTVVDFSLRRMHGVDAGLKGARAFHVAGMTATSNVLAGQVYGIPVQGTMAHSYIQAHDGELEAFRAFTRLYPDTVLLVDTYDTLGGVKRVIELAQELGADFEVRAIRLDSGDLGELASASRALLDEAGLAHVGIFASGGLDEWDVAKLLEQGAPIDGFGIGTRMGVSYDAPYLDIVYKLTEYAGTGRLKLSPGKRILPGRKQIFRVEEDGIAVADVLAGAQEEHPGRPLLVKVMEGGRRLAAGETDLEQARKRAASEIPRLPERIRALEPAAPPYEVRVSEELRAASRRASERVGG